MKSSYQILGILLKDRQGNFHFVPIKGVDGVEPIKKKKSSLNEESGVEEPLSPVDFKVETEIDKTPKSLDEALEKYKK